MKTFSPIHYLLGGDSLACPFALTCQKYYIKLLNNKNIIFKIPEQSIQVFKHQLTSLNIRTIAFCIALDYLYDLLIISWILRIKP